MRNSPNLITHVKRTFAFLTIASGLALGYGAFAPDAVAGNPNECKVCHKRTKTLSLPCNSSAPERHLAHGDTPGECPTSPTAKIDQTPVAAQPTRVTSAKPRTVKRVALQAASGRGGSAKHYQQHAH